jgi:dynein heavy chain
LISILNCYYCSNIRDVAKVIQGVLMAARSTVFTVESMLRLWVHECQRVFADRFLRTKSHDETKFRDILSAKLSECFNKDWPTIMIEALEPKNGPLFSGILTEPVENGVAIYEEVVDHHKLRGVAEDKLEAYNLEPKLMPMDLALFKDAIMHICRIHRVLIQLRGNMMLVGVGGSGRSSLARLAAFSANMSTFTIEITKNYRLTEFREDLKKLYITTGCEDKKVAFLFNDIQVIL